MKPDSTIKRICQDYFKDAELLLEKIRDKQIEFKNWGTLVGGLMVKEEIRQFRAQYEDAKLLGLAALEVVDDEEFSKETRQKFEELDKHRFWVEEFLAEKKDGQG